MYGEFSECFNVPGQVENLLDLKKKIFWSKIIFGRDMFRGIAEAPKSEKNRYFVLFVDSLP